jgi:hypothetical protein
MQTCMFVNCTGSPPEAEGYGADQFMYLGAIGRNGPNAGRSRGSDYALSCLRHVKRRPAAAEKSWNFRRGCATKYPTGSGQDAHPPASPPAATASARKNVAVTHVQRDGRLTAGRCGPAFSPFIQVKDMTRRGPKHTSTWQVKRQGFYRRKNGRLDPLSCAICASLLVGSCSKSRVSAWIRRLSATLRSLSSRHLEVADNVAAQVPHLPRHVCCYRRSRRHGRKFSYEVTRHSRSPGADRYG